MLSSIRARLIFLAGLFSAISGVAGPAPAAESSGFPEGWRELGGDEAPSFLPPRAFDFDATRSDRGRAEEKADPAERRPSANRLGGTSSRSEPAPTSRAKAVEALKQAMAPRESAAALRRRTLDGLFLRLRAATGLDEAKGVAEAIERIWLQSRSDTADLLMQRARVSIGGQNYPLALALLDQLVALEPEWAEAWNQRATTRFLADDPDGAMADIDQALKLEPRHFGALTGMGTILRRAGLEKRALQVLNKALEIHPRQPELREIVEKLTIEVEGRDI